MSRINKEFSISISRWTLRNILKSLGYKWKRIRKSLKSKRDQVAFIRFQKRLKNWHRREGKGELEVFYFDEVGFNLVPSVPYAWQKKNQQVEIFSQKGANHTVLGFMNKQMDFYSFIHTGRTKSEDVIFCIDEFCREIRKGKPFDYKTILVVDNAPTHTSGKFKQRMKYWKKQGLQIKFLPSYSPELNPIEILWRFIKYKWMPFKAYSCKKSLVNELIFILNNIGTKYRINFS